MEGPALGGDRGHGDDLVAGMEDLAKQLAPAMEGRVQQRPAVDVEQVEREKRHRPTRLARDPALELSLVRPAGVVDRDELPVEDRRPGIEPDRHAAELRQRRADSSATPVDDPDLAATGPLP